MDGPEVERYVQENLADAGLDGRSVCVLVPDGTRSCPLPLLLGAVRRALEGRVSRLTVLVALGTHAAMPDDALRRHTGGVPATQHAWWDESTFVDLGTIPAGRLAELSGGRLAVDVPVRVNRAVVDHDVVLVVGPVFPHEVVGFSGGTKYLFPGVGGPEMIDVSHWLGALITSAAIIGTLGTTPVRALIDEAAAMVPSELLSLSLVTAAGGRAVDSLFFGDVHPAWAAAAEASSRAHVRYLDEPVPRVLSLLPDRYDDLWTGAKGFYKVEPVVADGGEVVIHAPGITAISTTHPAIAEIGYHCRDFFLGQWERYRHYRWGDLAHSTHLRGAGTWDPETGERARVTITLATGIPEHVVRSVGLGYLDPATIDVDAWRSDPGTLVVPDAGEVLYRLATRS